MFRPEIFKTLKDYNHKQLLSDSFAGIIVAVVAALPLSIAFAIASGVTPEKGLYTAIIAGFIVSLLGGTSVQISGPTGTFIVIIFGIITKYGTEGLIIATIIAGIFLIIMGIARLGNVIQFIPYPVVIGFTSGAAVIIFTSQMNNFTGMVLNSTNSTFIGKWHDILTNINLINPWALSLGFLTIGVILGWRKINKSIPGSIIALSIVTLLVIIFKLPVDTIGTKFGEMPSGFPIPGFPVFPISKIGELIIPAFTLAILIGIESLLSAVVADGMIEKKHNSNTELIAQGIANITCGIFGGIPATGAIARTATNIKNGGRTPIAGIVTSITLLFILLFLGSFAELIPLSALAGVLVVVSYNMSEWRSFRAILRCPASDIIVVTSTFLLTIIFDLTVAIQIGVIMSLLLFMRRMNMVSNINVIRDEYTDEKEIDDPLSVKKIELPEHVEIYEINGPFFFGAAEKFKNEMLYLEKQPKVRILRMRHVPAIDASGIKLLEDIYRDCRKHNISLILSGIREQPRLALRKAGLENLIGQDNIQDNINNSINRAKVILGITPPSLADKILRGGIFRNIEGNDSLSMITGIFSKINLPSEIDGKKLLKSLLEREELMSTGIGEGIAIPHSLNPGFTNFENEFIAICCNEKAIDFRAIDNKPVDVIIITVSATSSSHLQNISMISRICMDRKFTEMLRNGSQDNEIIEYIRKFYKNP